MRILVLPINDKRAQQIAEELKKMGHDVWVSDSKSTEVGFRNFIKVNPVNFEALAMAFKIANPEEIHVVCEKSILRNMHLILASIRASKLVLHFKEENSLLDSIAKAFSKDFGFKYECQNY